MATVTIPNLLPDADPNLVEFCKNLLFASHNKECKSTKELLQKVVALKCIQDNSTMSTVAPSPSSSEPCCSSSGTSSSSLPSSSSKTETSGKDKNDQDNTTVNTTPIFFSSMTAVLTNLNKAGVDPIVAEQIALDRLCSPSANPLSVMSQVVINGVAIYPVDETVSTFVKNILKRLHDHENFTLDGAPYPFDVKSALRYSEHYHNQIPALKAINPLHVAHEQSITFSAMARFVAMHEVNIDLKLLFPVESQVLDEHAYYSAAFWTYREAFKSFYYPKMPAPLPQKFKLSPEDHLILTRYWDAGNRHVTATESVLLNRRCPTLAPFQIYGYFDKRRRNEYNRYRGLKDDETLAMETTQVWRKLIGMKQSSDDDDSDDDEEEMIQREFLSKDDKTKLNYLWELGHRRPSHNECELLAADLQMKSGDQIYAYFEDRRWHEDYQNRKKAEASARNFNINRVPAEKIIEMEDREVQQSTSSPQKAESEEATMKREEKPTLIALSKQISMTVPRVEIWNRIRYGHVATALRFRSLLLFISSTLISFIDTISEPKTLKPLPSEIITRIVTSFIKGSSDQHSLGHETFLDILLEKIPNSDVKGMHYHEVYLAISPMISSVNWARIKFDRRDAMICYNSLTRILHVCFDQIGISTLDEADQLFLGVYVSSVWCSILKQHPELSQPISDHQDFESYMKTWIFDSNFENFSKVFVASCCQILESSDQIKTRYSKVEGSMDSEGVDISQPLSLTASIPETSSQAGPSSSVLPPMSIHPSWRTANYEPYMNPYMVAAPSHFPPFTPSLVHPPVDPHQEYITSPLQHISTTPQAKTPKAPKRKQKLPNFQELADTVMAKTRKKGPQPERSINDSRDRGESSSR